LRLAGNPSVALRGDAELTSSLLINKLALVGGASAQAMANLRIQLVGNQLTAQLNKRIAQLKAQSDDAIIPALQAQARALTKQQSGYDAAQGQLAQNGMTLSDLTLQLGNLAAAAQAGDAGKFDLLLRSAATDVANLALVGFQPGLQPDGVLALKTSGLGIQSSAVYDLSTPAGQAQATADVNAALAIAQQIFTQTTQNQAIATSASKALDGRISALSDQISSRQVKELGAAATEITKLKQQTQQRFHLIELAFGNVGQSASILTSVQNATNIAPPPGSIISLLVGPSGGPTLAVANLSPIAAPVTVASGNSRGSTVSTKA
jgi:hypothetical protein